MRNLILAIISVLAICSCQSNTVKNTQGTPIKIINPATDWDVSGGGDGNLPPRNEVSVPGGTGTYPDNGETHEGRKTGVVFFGPPVQGGAIGATDSVATTTFHCGDRNGICVVKLTVAGNIVGGSGPGDNEYLVMTLSGGGNSDSKRHPGNAAHATHVLSIPGCGDVTLTLKFEENVTASNPKGIQTKFVSRISEYGCN